jgi:hypothetical protein
MLLDVEVKFDPCNLDLSFSDSLLPWLSSMLFYTGLIVVDFVGTSDGDEAAKIGSAACLWLRRGHFRCASFAL